MPTLGMRSMHVLLACCKSRRSLADMGSNHHLGDTPAHPTHSRPPPPTAMIRASLESRRPVSLTQCLIHLTTLSQPHLVLSISLSVSLLHHLISLSRSSPFKPPSHSASTSALHCRRQPAQSPSVPWTRLLEPPVALPRRASTLPTYRHLTNDVTTTYHGYHLPPTPESTQQDSLTHLLTGR